MSGPDAASRPVFTTGGLALFITGAALLVAPGGCSLYFLITALPEILRAQNNSYLVFIYIPVGAGFVVAGVGYWMMRAGLKRRGAPVSADPNRSSNSGSGDD